jgi:hypothetical protein
MLVLASIETCFPANATGTGKSDSSERKDFPYALREHHWPSITHKTIPRGVWLKSGARKSGTPKAAKSSQFVATAQQSWQRSNHF